MKKRTNLLSTALYTAGVWSSGGLDGADLFDHPDSRRILHVVNAALRLAKLFMPLPDLPASLLQRHHMIDSLVQELAPAAVIEIGAGLSARGVRLTSDPRIEYFEVDRPMVLERKRTLAERTEPGRAVLERPNLHFIAADIQADALDGLLPQLSGRQVFIAEGLFMYLKEAEQMRLLAAIWARCRSGDVLLFDWVPTCEQPPSGGVGRLLGWTMSRLTRGGKFVRDARTRADVAAALRQVGFADVRSLEPANAPVPWQVPHLDKKTQQLLFVARA